MIGHMLAWAAGAYLVFEPFYSDGSTLVEVNGLWVVRLLLVPVLLTGVGLAAAVLTRRRVVLRRVLLWASAVLLLGACILSTLTIGVFYVAAALALLVAAIGDLWPSRARG